MLVQGDEHNIYFSLKFSGIVIDPSTDDLQGLKVKIGRIIKEYTPDSSSSEVNYDEGLRKWYIKLTQQQTLSMPVEVPMQVQVKIGDEIFTSLVKTATVHGSIIKEIWSDE